MNTSDNGSGANAGRGSSTLAAGSRQGHAGQGHAGQGHAGQGHAGQGHAGQGHAGQGGGRSGALSSVEGAVGGSTGGSSVGIRAVPVGGGGVDGGAGGGRGFRRAKSEEGEQEGRQRGVRERLEQRVEQRLEERLNAVGMGEGGYRNGVVAGSSGTSSLSDRRSVSSSVGSSSCNVARRERRAIYERRLGRVEAEYGNQGSVDESHLLELQEEQEEEEEEGGQQGEEEARQQQQEEEEEEGEEQQLLQLQEQILLQEELQSHLEEELQVQDLEQREQRGVDRLGNRRGSAPRLLGVYRRHGREDRHRLEELTENLEDGESTLSGITIDVPPGGDDYNEGDYSAENAGGSNSGSMGYTGVPAYVDGLGMVGLNSGLVGGMDDAMGGRMDGDMDGDGVAGLGAGTVSYGAGLRRFPSGLEGMEGVGSGGVGFEGVVSGGAGRVEEEEVEAELLAMEAAVEYNVRVVTCQGSPVRWHNCHVCVRPNAVLLDAAGCIVVDGRELRARDGSPVVLEEQGESLIHALIDFSPPLVHLSFIHAFLDLDPRAVVLQETAVRVNRWLSDRQNQHEVVAQFLTCDRRL
ncbi:unnamed protein product [Closterium sp. Naga37s-1]|nr:unnamed protein product [Closterium sp. Naga37s-1]